MRGLELILIERCLPLALEQSGGLGSQSTEVLSLAPDSHLARISRSAQIGGSVPLVPLLFLNPALSLLHDVLVGGFPHSPKPDVAR